VVDVPVTLLADDFSHFHDETAQTPKSDRVRLFRERFNRLLPGFYEPRYGKSQAAYDAQVANALDGFPTIRRDYDRMLARFPSALASGVTHVRQTFRISGRISRSCCCIPSAKWMAAHVFCAVATR
jgi:hypothetical protein